MSDPVTALAIVGFGGPIGKGAMQYKAAQEKEKALDFNNDGINETFNGKGINISKSPSFNAIQRETLNTSAKVGKNTDLEKTLMHENIDIEKQNVKNTLYAQLFGDASDAAISFAALQGKMA